MHQISNLIYADDALLAWDIPTKRLPNPYQELPYMLIKGVLNADECHVINNAVRCSHDAVAASLRGSDVDEQIRKTDIYTLSPEHLALYHARFDAHRPAIESFFSLSLSSATEVQVLGYEPGAFYVRHADDSSELRNHDGHTVGFVPVAPQRKLSTVLFTTSSASTPEDNDHFSGGELRFNYLYDAKGSVVTLQPEAGDMVVFLSNPYFTHEVLPVKKGFRLSLVQWHDALI